MYRTHCQCILDTVVPASFKEVDIKFVFWFFSEIFLHQTRVNYKLT